MTAQFVGQAVKMTHHTSTDPSTDLYRQFGRVLAIGPLHTTVEFEAGRVYVVESDLVVDAGAAS